MRIDLYGGFGERGRTCLGIESGGYRLLLDAGVKTSARGTPDYYPIVPPAVLAELDALIVTHGHEDHAAALGWCIANGFQGSIFMTAETRRDTEASLADYAPPDHLGLARRMPVEQLPIGRNALRVGPFRIATGRSGHIAGGLWCALEDAHTRFVYCGDVVPDSLVFAMDAVPPADAIALDASYGDDDATTAERAAQIAQWTAAHPRGCVLPSPLHGRSAELLSIVPGPIALAPGMREALRRQIAGVAWLVAGAAARLRARLESAADWQDGEALPHAALLCHDAMGISGPSRRILREAEDRKHPTLFTGHVPAGSAAAGMLAAGHAQWIRLPTHPRRSDNVALAQQCGAGVALGHSCEAQDLERLAAHLPGLRARFATGDRLEL